MKKLIIIILMLIITKSAFGQNLKTLDDKYGFRDAIFEMPKDSLKHLVEVEKNYFSSTDEKLSLGDYKLKDVVYRFYKNQLIFIMIRTEGLVNSTGVLKILQTAYGTGYQSNEFIEKYYWFGEKVTMSYNQNSITDDATIILTSNKLVELENAEKEKANAEAAKQL